MNLALWFEDIVPGHKVELGRYTFAHDQMIAFARRYDPQAFHVDDEAAQRSHFRRLCASGLHTGAAFMWCLAACQAACRAELQGCGGMPPPGITLGFQEMRWLKPVHAGDTITYFSEVLFKQELASRREWGLVSRFNTGTDHSGEIVFSFQSNDLSPRRAA